MAKKTTTPKTAAKTSPKTTATKPSTLASRLQAQQSKADCPPHLIVEARAGTGKTTTLIEGLKLIKGIPSTLVPSPQQAAVWEQMQLSRNASSICFVAFNKSIATELQRRVPEGCTASTMHSMGLKAVTANFGRLDIPRDASWVVRERVAKVLGMDVREIMKTRYDMLAATCKLVSLCKMNLVDASSVEDLQNLAAHYEIELNGSASTVFDTVPKVLALCRDPKADGRMDFDDMIWLPVALNLPVAKYDLLLVDECLPGWTPVMLGNGGSKPIKDIVKGDTVRGYDTASGRAVNRVVTATQKIPNKKPLVKIKVRHNHKTAGNRKCNFVVCTTDHKVWTVNRGWVQAGNVQIGDTVVVETAASTTQKGKISKSGRDNLSAIHVGNSKGNGNNGQTTAEQFNSIKGGNGRGLTTSQALLLEALGDSWKSEYVLKTGCAPQFGRGVHPSNYKIDIANPKFKIAIELDGNSHRGAETTDRKKDKFLQEQGWTVYRFTNRQVARDFAGILQTVCPNGTNCPMPATVESVEDTYITEHYVYDITVNGCHNFYANGILVHNCQDLNRCQQALARKAGNRLILVGDPKQAIYGFAGADSESMPRLSAELSETPAGCVTLPLTVTRRCGKAIVAEAQKYVADFAAFDSNPEGTIGRAKYEATGIENAVTYHGLVQDGDMLLCRVNAPLVSQCFRFLKAGRKAYIQGKDVGAGLISTIKKLCKIGKGPELNQSIVDLSSALSEWLHSEQAKENAKRNPAEARLIALQDRYDCLSCFCEDASTVDAVIAKIEAVFSDNDQEGIRLSSVHKAKGLEAHRVFILQPKGATMPHPMAKSVWQREQEFNLLYVAITRAINELVYVS